MELLWLIPSLPLLGAAANGLLGPRVDRRLTSAVALGSTGLSALLALVCIARYIGTMAPAPFELVLYPWIAGPLQIDVAFLLDPLSAVMTFVVTFVGFWIHVYSVGYMANERGFQRYFVYLNLFMGMMLLLVLGNNYLIAFVGWEGVGLCSYLLIGFYYDQDVASRAGRKAFVVNRIGDFAFLVGMFALLAEFGTLSYRPIIAAMEADPTAATRPYALGIAFATFVGLCLLGGAIGKSAQIPLFVWLPDAMAGPTPVSALIHAATMVTAGVYMIVRSNVFFQLTPTVLALVAVVGGVTALFAATIALAQTDIKKVLAYSTVSQLGYMFLAVGVGAYSLAIFHLFTHAFFKALLFLGSGSVIHAMSGEQDLRAMGGLKRHLPATHLTFLIATLAIAGVPGLAGFFSKDAILAAAFDGTPLLWALGLVAAVLTACYMFRLYFMTFHGKFRGTPEQREHLHESPWTMTLPLWILAVGSLLAGYLGKVPFTHLDHLGDFLGPVVTEMGTESTHGGHHGLELEATLVGLSVLAAAAGIFTAWRLYGRGRGLAGGEAAAARFPKAHALLVNAYWIDELYEVAVVRPLIAVARFCWRVIDTILINGSTHVGAFLVELTGDLARFTTTGNVRNYALYVYVGFLVLIGWLVF